MANDALLVTVGARVLRHFLHPLAAASGVELGASFDKFVDLLREARRLDTRCVELFDLKRSTSSKPAVAKVLLQDASAGKLATSLRVERLFGFCCRALRNCKGQTTCLKQARSKESHNQYHST